MRVIAHDAIINRLRMKSVSGIQIYFIFIIDGSTKKLMESPFPFPPCSDIHRRSVQRPGCNPDVSILKTHSPVVFKENGLSTIFSPDSDVIHPFRDCFSRLALPILSTTFKFISDAAVMSFGQSRISIRCLERSNSTVLCPSFLSVLSRKSKLRALALMDG